MSVATRLALTVLVVSIASFIITAIVAVTGAQGSGDELVRDRIPALRTAKAGEIEQFFMNQRNAVGQLALSPTVFEGTQAFAAAHNELASTLEVADVAEAEARLDDFYAAEFVPALEAVRSSPVTSSTFSLEDDLAGTYLQDLYLASNPFDTEDHALLVDANDGSAWTDAHRELHPWMRRVVARYGFVDLFLVEPEGGVVVYSTLKEVDFATSLSTGPYSATSLGGLVGRALREGSPGDVFIADHSQYPPSLDAPSIFYAAPLFDGDELVGALAVQVDSAGINSIMSREWRAGRLGETGEIYLVGPDRRMRSDARLFVEEPDTFLAHVEATEEVSDEDIAGMSAQDTTVLFYPVTTESVEAAFAIDDGVIEIEHLQEEVYSAYEPLGVQGLDWVIIAEQSRSEVLDPVDAFRTESLVLVAVFVTVLTFVAVLWSSAFVAPVRSITAAVGRFRDGQTDTKVPSHGVQEFRDLGADFDQMIQTLTERQAEIAQAAAEKRSLLSRLLPPSAARAVAEGDRTMLDVAPQASVAVVVVAGLDDLARARSATSNRDLMHELVNQLDRAAESRGLERVKVVGDTYFGVCGLDHAYLDHAPRALAFAVNARDIVRALGESVGHPLDVSAGLDSGTVTVGLTGATRLVYDLWGDTVNTAYRLARLAGPGELIASDATATRLPADLLDERVEVDARSSGAATQAAWIVDPTNQTMRSAP
ncbi:MAG: adenylate/guanylate cyclase domain-containing protein [Acidimicrobiales bacterium]